MNEPIEHAQKECGVATAKQLLTLLRHGWRVGVHGRAAIDRASYSNSFVFDLSISADATKKRGAQERHEISIPGWVSNGLLSVRKEFEETRSHHGVSAGKYVRYTDYYRPTSGFWYLMGATDNLISVLDGLPPDAQVGLHVYLDAGTNEYLVRADAQMQYDRVEGLHCDHLYLVAWFLRRGKRVERKFLIDTMVVPHNTSRFGYERGQ